MPTHLPIYNLYLFFIIIYLYFCSSLYSYQPAYLLISGSVYLSILQFTKALYSAEFLWD